MRAGDVVALAAILSATALLFAIHPVRVEVVAWASALPYVLALSLTLVSLLAYLRFTDRTTSARPWWLALSVCAYGLSLLSRANALLFPFVLLALDVYPL